MIAYLREIALTVGMYALAVMATLATLEFFGLRAPLREALARGRAVLRAKMAAWRQRRAARKARGDTPVEPVHLYAGVTNNWNGAGWDYVWREGTEVVPLAETVAAPECVRCHLFNCICAAASPAEPPPEDDPSVDVRTGKRPRRAPRKRGK